MKKQTINAKLRVFKFEKRRCSSKFFETLILKNTYERWQGNE